AQALTDLVEVEAERRDAIEGGDERGADRGRCRAERLGGGADDGVGEIVSRGPRAWGRRRRSGRDGWQKRRRRLLEAERDQGLAHLGRDLERDGAVSRVDLAREARPLRHREVAAPAV